MPFNVPSEVGELYDVGIETRDGSTLNCTGMGSHTYAISKVGYVCSPSHPQEEATELQEKAKITQLASPNISDREFDQWPQVSQGDWSGGIRQRLYPNVNTATQSAVGGDPTRFWDGSGVIWPLDDVVPQQLLALPVVTRTVGADNLIPIASPIGLTIGPAGNVGNFSKGIWGTLYLDSTTNHVRFLRQSADTFFDTDINASLSAGAANVYDFLFFSGYYWIVSTSAAALSSVWYVGQDASVTKLADLPVNVIPGSAVIGVPPVVAGGKVGSHTYLAVPWYTGNIDPTQAGTQVIRLYDITQTTGNAAAFVGNVSVDLKLDSHDAITDVCFLGDNLYVATCPGGLAGNVVLTEGVVHILAYNIPSQTWSRVAELRGHTFAFMAPVLGGVFILAWTWQQTQNVALAELYLLQGTSLQGIGPLSVQVGNSGYSAATTFSKVTSISQYAVFAAYPTDSVNTWFAPYAYDVLRGRLFKMGQDQLGALENNAFCQRLGVVRNATRTFNGAQRVFEWLLVRQDGASVGTTPQRIVHEYGLGVSNLVNYGVGLYTVVSSPPVRQGCVIIGSIIDLTSAQPKLFRQYVAQFDPLPNDASISVTLDVWLDRDPASLSAIPDFTATVAGNVSAGTTQLAVPINKLAVKIVYRVTITGGTAASGGLLIAAPKLRSVAVQLSTGWTWHLFLDLAESALTNAGEPGDYTFTRQGLDSLAAYNFLRQLWRQKGGQCKLTMPNGDSYNAAIQSFKGQSPKPYGATVSNRNPAGRYEQVAEIVIREDI